MKKIKIGVVGLGYVGLPVSVAFSNKYKVIGYDIDLNRVNELNYFNDNTLEITSNKLKTRASLGAPSARGACPLPGTPCC